MNPLKWNFRLQCAVGFLVCAGLLAFAIYMQLAMGLEPCPMCIYQRLAFAATALVFLAGVIHGPRERSGRATYGILAAVMAVIGIVLAARHVYVQLLPPEMGFSCGPPLSFLNQTQGFLGAFRTVLTGTANCGVIDWTFLGLSMPMWSLVWFVLLAAWALVIGLRRGTVRR